MIDPDYLKTHLHPAQLAYRGGRPWEKRNPLFGSHSDGDNHFGYTPVTTDSRPLYDDDRQGYVEFKAPEYPKKAELIRAGSVQEGLDNSLKADMLMPDLTPYMESSRLNNLQDIKDRYKTKISEKIQAGDFNAVFFNLCFIGEDITTWIYSHGPTHQVELESPERPKKEVLAFCEELKMTAESIDEGVTGRAEFLKYINEILVRFS